MKHHLKWAPVILVACFAASVAGYASRSGSAAATAPSGQDIMSVDRRVSTLEQRIYTIDSNITQIQQQVMMISRNPAPSAGASGEVQQLRLELNLLRSQMNQIECALAKLDERTLAPARPKTRSVKDPCRLDPQTPIEMPGHPY